MVGYCGEAREWTPELVSLANETLSTLAWSTFSEVHNLRMNEDRLSDSFEGWWCVRFDLICPLGESEPTSHAGVVCGPNCD